MNIMRLMPLMGCCFVLSACNLNGRADDENIKEKAFLQALKTPSRPIADKERDAGRKPHLVMQFADIAPGMTVLDLVASGGYYTEVLSHRVGPTGKVLAQNNEFILTVRDGRFNKEITQRLSDDRLPNVERFDREFGEFGLNEEVDAITMMLNYHDLYSRPEAMRKSVLAELRQSLKADGVFVVIDMQAKPGAHNPKLHRVNSQAVLREVQAAGFMLEKEGMFLRNPDDDHSKVVFDKSIRGKTDRFVFVFKKISR